MLLPDTDFFAHSTAVIDAPCRIGKGTRIWHYSHVMPNSVVGEDCNIGQNVVISPNCVIGRGVKIQNNVSVYSGVTIEDDVFLGPSMVFTNVINPRAFIERKAEYRPTVVGQGCTVRECNHCLRYAPWSLRHDRCGCCRDPRCARLWLSNG